MNQESQQRIEQVEQLLARALSEKASLDSQIKTLQDQLAAAGMESGQTHMPIHDSPSLALQEAVPLPPQNLDNEPQQKQEPFFHVLRSHLECLKDADLEDSSEMGGKVVESLAIVVQLLKKVDQTIYSQLEVLGKNHPRIKTMAQAMQSQDLLNIEEVLRGVLSAKSRRMTRLINYAELLLRWWSAVLAGVQSTVLEVPNELTEELNPAKWELEKKRWASEEEAFWNHFKYVIRNELPLKVGDKMKSIQADKTLEAYTILGGGQLLGTAKK